MKRKPKYGSLGYRMAKNTTITVMAVAIVLMSVLVTIVSWCDINSFGTFSTILITVVSISEIGILISIVVYKNIYADMIELSDFLVGFYDEDGIRVFCNDMSVFEKISPDMNELTIYRADLRKNAEKALGYEVKVRTWLDTECNWYEENIELDTFLENFKVYKKEVPDI